MKLYEFFASRNWPRSYTGKILLVSFLGVHVPMFGAVTYALVADPTPFMEQLDVLAAMLIATLVGTAATMFVMASLLAPVRLASTAAQSYLDTGELPQLPTRYTDGAGVLLASVQEAITRLDGAVSLAHAEREAVARNHNDKFRMLAGMKHDFRTPLTVILGFADLMKTQSIGEYGGAAYRDYATTIGKSGQDLLQTLQSVLDLSDAEAQSEFDHDREPLDLVALAKAAAAREHFHADRRNVGVKIEAPETVPVDTVRGAGRDLIGTMLQTAIARVPEGGEVTLAVTGGSRPSVQVTAHGTVLNREDLPQSLSAMKARFESGTGEGNETEATTPTTLRLSLIETFCHAMRGTFDLSQSPDGLNLRVGLTPRPHLVAIAAE